MPVPAPSIRRLLLARRRFELGTGYPGREQGRAWRLALRIAERDSDTWSKALTRLRIGHLGLPTLLAGVGLVVVLMIATCLRMAGIAYDRPYVYYPDEWAIAKPAMQIVSSGDPDPHSFTYPTLLIYAETGVVEAVHAVSGVSLVTATPQGAGGMAGASGTDFQTSQFPYVMWGRRLVALMGVLTCLLVALGGRWAAGGGGRREWASGAVQPEDGPGAASARAEGVATENEDSDRAPAIGQGDRGWFAGVAGAAFMAVAVLPLGHSRNLTTDVPCSLFTAATMAITLAALARPPDRTSDRLLILAGFLAGLAASTKYNAAVVGVVPLIGYMIHAGSPRALGHWLPDAIRRKTPYLILAAAAAGFVIATPMILFDASGVLGGLRDQVVHYNVQGHVGAQGDSAGYYVDYLWNIGFGPVLSILSLAGVAWACPSGLPTALLRPGLDPGSPLRKEPVTARALCGTPGGPFRGRRGGGYPIPHWTSLSVAG
jgi:hypothetical protein